MVDWLNVAGISCMTLSFIAAVFTQEELMISLGLSGIYCAIRNIYYNPPKEVTE